MKVFFGASKLEKYSAKKKNALVPILAAKGRQETHGTGKTL